MVYAVYETAEYPFGSQISLVNQKIYYVALGIFPAMSLYLPSTFHYARKWVLGYGLYWQLRSANALRDLG